MNNTPALQRMLELFENRDGVVIGVAAVNYHRAVAVAGNLQLPAKHVPLHGAIGIVVEIVQPDLAHGHDLVVGGMLANFRLHLIGIGFRFMGMNALGTKHPVSRTSQLAHCRQVLW